MHKKLLSVLLVLCLLISCISVAALADESILIAPAPEAGVYANGPDVYALEADAVLVVLSDEGITIDGAPVSDDPESDIFVAHDIVYYEAKTEYEDTGFAYGEGTQADMHSAREAAAHTVLHINKAGTYRLTGKLSCGQVAFDLGEDSFTDPTAVVNVILDNVDVTCTVGPAIVFYNAYECDNEWEANFEANGVGNSNVDTTNAGVNVIIADGSVNNFAGAHVAKIYKNKGENGVSAGKKLWKQDGTFYSYRSMNIFGEAKGDGRLNINAENEGLDSELHLTIWGGLISIISGDDGINTNEDFISTLTVNGGVLHILAGVGAEGDGVDSNGYLVINGGTVIAMANPRSDSGLDSDCGSYVNGGTVVALGSTMDWAESESEQVTINLQFAASQDAGEAIVVTDLEGKVIFAYDPSEDEIAGSNIRTYTGAVVSCGNFQVGETYNLFLDGVVTGEEQQGVYDAATITAYEGGLQQVFTNTDGFMMGGPGGGPGGMPGEMPEGFQPPEGGFPGEPGEGGPGGPPPMGGEMPEGFQPPEGGFPGPGAGGPPPMDGGMPPMGGPGGMGGSREIDYEAANTAFYMTDKVNRFSGITDVETVAEGLLMPFSDVAKDAPYYDAVAALYQKGIMIGTGKNTFSPDLAVNRAMAVTVLGRVLGWEPAETSAFSDVEAGSWYAGYVDAANAQGLVVGYGDGTFGPEDTLTGEQLTLIVARVAAQQAAALGVDGAIFAAALPTFAGETVTRAELALTLFNIGNTVSALIG